LFVDTTNKDFHFKDILVKNIFYETTYMHSRIAGFSFTRKRAGRAEGREMENMVHFIGQRIPIAEAACLQK
jgi:hypothetical protein